MEKVKLEHIDQTYDRGQTFIIKDFDLSIEDKQGQGEFAVILGKSGCGKSSVLRYMAGLQTPSAGTININGKQQTKDDYISMVFQQYSSLPWLTVWENVKLGMKFRHNIHPDRYNDGRVKYFLNEVGLYELRDRYAVYPKLSGGQLQRVAIARALISNPEIILMDEPFGALDTHTRLRMQDLLADMWMRHHPTIIFVTHDMSGAVYLGDDIYVMSPQPNAHIIKHIPVSLPLERTPEIKRTPEFLNLFYELEDTINAS